MIVDCQNCNKKFELDENLIPAEGRILQCGSCNHKWLFRIENDFKKIKDEIIPIDAEKIINEAESALKKNEETKIQVKPNKIKENKYNYFKIFLVIILSIAALILVLDTFKNQLIFIFPDIKIILDNLYQSIIDIKLFILDLIKY